MHALGYEVLITIILPGLAVLAALCMAIDSVSPGCGLTDRVCELATDEWQFTLVALLSSVFLGTLWASLTSFWEHCVLDAIGAWRLGIGTDEYDAEWNRYVDSVEKGQNAYVSRLVLFMFFENRAGWAAVALGVALAVWPRVQGLWISVAVIAIGLLLLGAGAFDHRDLARFRHRRYPKGG
jgi:hypothetical protein